MVGNPHAFHGFFDGQLRYLSSNFEVFGLANKGEWIRKTEECEGIKIFENNIERNISPLKDIVSFFKTAHILKKLKPDMIHANTPKVGLVGILAGKFAGIKTRVYMCHGLRYQGASGIFKRILMFCEKITCKTATHVICVSHSVRESLLKDGICSLNKTFVVRQGSVCGCKEEMLNYILDQNIAQKIKMQLGILDDGSFIFCFIGRIVLDKGIKELVSAFKNLSDDCNKVHLIIVGSIDSDNSPTLTETLKTIESTTNIHHVGWQDDIKPFITISDVIVLPSYREGLSTTLIEAGALGKPAITTNVTGCKDIIKNKYNGLLIDSPHEKDTTEIISQLERSMKSLYKAPKETLSQYGNNAKYFIKENFDKKKLWEAYKDLYLNFTSEL